MSFDFLNAVIAEAAAEQVRQVDRWIETVADHAGLTVHGLAEIAVLEYYPPSITLAEDGRYVMTDSMRLRLREESER